MTCEHEFAIEPGIVKKWCGVCGAIHVIDLGFTWIEPDRNDCFPVFSGWEQHMRAAVEIANAAGKPPVETISALVMILLESVDQAELVRDSERAKVHPIDGC